jgi:hypothetical protein
MRHLMLFTATLLLVAGCSTSAPKAAAISSPSSPSSPSASPAGPTPSTVAVMVSGGCGSTPAHKGGVPAWLDAAGANNNPDFLPYIVANPPNAAAFLFAYPLRAGHPGDPSNKIFWVVRLPRNGTDLQITGHPAGATTPTIRDSFPANSSPGEIYPSIVDVPKAGCWHFDLTWAGHAAAVELQFV